MFTRIGPFGPLVARPDFGPSRARHQTCSSQFGTAAAVRAWATIAARMPAPTRPDYCSGTQWPDSQGKSPRPPAHARRPSLPQSPHIFALASRSGVAVDAIALGRRLVGVESSPEAHRNTGSPSSLPRVLHGGYDMD